MFKELIQYYLDEFQRVGEPALVTICNCNIPTKILLEQYKKLPPIESTPEKDRREMWEYVKQLFPGRSNEQLIDYSKVIYTIGNLI